MEENRQLLHEIAVQCEKGDADAVRSLTVEALEHCSAESILNQGLMSGMECIGVKFKNNEVFIPEVLIAARAMKAGMAVLKPRLAEARVASKGKILMGTVKGDLHDIGKNIVSMLLQGAGFEVVDMGTDVGVETIIQMIRETEPQILGLSALLTTTMICMEDVIKGLEKAGLRDRIKVIIGGAPITQAYADEIGADGYAPDAAVSVDLVRGLLASV
ncbi:MAG TPA: cobalamin-binding protein [bacterium]|nr:cobalamin-binding protein [bacterium]